MIYKIFFYNEENERNLFFQTENAEECLSKMDYIHEELSRLKCVIGKRISRTESILFTRCNNAVPCKYTMVMSTVKNN